MWGGNGNNNQNSTSNESDWLLSYVEQQNVSSGVPQRDYLTTSDRSQDSVFRDYDDLAVTVVENKNHEPVVVHDFSGVNLAKLAGIEQNDSIASSIYNDPVDLSSSFPQTEDVVLGGGKATVAQEIASMTKGIVGCGALSLCNGLALCADNPKVLVAGFFWIIIIGILFGYFCWLIGKICVLTKRSTYRGIWQDTVGHSGALAVSIANALKAGMTDLACSTILADSTMLLLKSLNLEVPRYVCLLLITGLGILPLCQLPNLAVLAPYSVVGTAGMVLTTVVMAVRYWDGSYQPGGQYYEDVPVYYRPSFGTRDGSWSISVLPFVCMVFEAYVMAYNSPRFYTELKHRTLPRFGVAVSSSYTMAAVMYAGLTSFGFLTFGGHSAGFILNNYSPNDPLATTSRMAVAVSTLVAYPVRVVFDS